MAKHGRCAGVLVDTLGDMIILFGAGLGFTMVVAAPFHGGWLAIDTSWSSTEPWVWLGGVFVVELTLLGLSRGRVGKRFGGLLLAIYAVYLGLELVQAVLPG